MGVQGAGQSVFSKGRNERGLDNEKKSFEHLALRVDGACDDALLCSERMG